MTITWTNEDYLRLDCEDDAKLEQEPVIVGHCCLCEGEVREEDAVTCGKHEQLAHAVCAEEKYGDSSLLSEVYSK